MWKKNEMKFHASMFDDPRAAADVLEKRIWEITKDTNLRFVRHESPHIVFCRQTVDQEFIAAMEEDMGVKVNTPIKEVTKPFYPLLDYAKNPHHTDPDTPQSD